MAYNDELGVVLDKLSRNDLVYYAVEILKVDTNQVSELSDDELRQRCSKELRSAGGHSFRNIFRDDHDLPYRVTVEDVARRKGIKVGPHDDVLIMERKLIDEEMRRQWENADDETKAKLVDLLKNLAKGKGWDTVFSRLTKENPGQDYPKRNNQGGGLFFHWNSGSYISGSFFSWLQ